MSELVLLIELAPQLTPAITNKELNRLSNRPNLDFPQVKKSIGRHKFYDREEVVEWYTLYKRATVNHKGPNKYGVMNGPRQER